MVATESYFISAVWVPLVHFKLFIKRNYEIPWYLKFSKCKVALKKVSSAITAE